MGAHEGFTEALHSNLSLLRRRMKTPLLRFEMHTMGSLSHTDVSICWMDDRVPPDLLQQIRDALSRVRDAVDARLALPPRTGAFALVSPQVEDGTIALRDNAVNDVSLGGGSVAFAFPERTEGFARSFILRLTMEARTEWTLPDGVSFEGDDDDALGELAEGETAALFFSETREDVFLVSRKAARAVVKG